MVVPGLVLEYFHEIPESIKKFRRTRSWKPICIVAGGLLITVGVAGELLVQSIASRKETVLRKANDGLIAELNAETAGARKEAGRAIERAAQLGKEAEDERLARVELEAKVAWRRIGKAEQSKAVSEVKQFSGQPALISCSATDQEEKTFAADIAAILHQARWDVLEPFENISIHEGPVPYGTNPAIPPGVLVWSTTDEGSQKAARRIVQMPTSRGFDAVISKEANAASLIHFRKLPTCVVISVVQKPEGPQGEFKLTQPGTPASSKP